MKRFTELFEALDQTTRTSAKVAALEEYFRAAPPEDAAWALHFLSGRRLRRSVKVTALRAWAAEFAGIPSWLFDECYETVGDLAETLSLILPEPAAPAEVRLAVVVEDWLKPLAREDEPAQRERMRRSWDLLTPAQRFLWHKLITGGFRVGVSRALLTRALAGVAGLEPAVLAHRLMGDWKPTAEGFRRLLGASEGAQEPAQPYPFALASPLECAPAELGGIDDWQVEWKWDGIRAQLLRRSGECVLWSRGEEVITGAFPEIRAAAAALPDGVVLDGELLAWRGDAPLPFAQLQRRLNRQTAAARLQAEVPVIFMAYDLVEDGGVDIRGRGLEERRSLLARRIRDAATRPAAPREAVDWIQPDLFDAAAPGSPAPEAAPFPIRVSVPLEAASWADVAALQEQARTTGTEGLMLKRRASHYGVGRVRGDWWKWKVSPFTCDAVLVGAQPGHGRRATLFTDYTLAVWQGGELVTVAKAYSGLTDAEIDEVDAFVRSHTLGKFGPVRSVRAEIVFEIAFEGIAASTRHKAGIALRFPRIARWRRDKKAAEADTLDSLRRLAGLEAGS